MKIRHAVAALLLPVLLAACGERGTSDDRGADAASPAGADSVKAWLSFNEGMALAEKERKPVVIDFYTSWCHWCKVMDRETFSEPGVKRYLAENFVAIRINAENKGDSLFYQGENYSPFSLGRRFGVRGFPTPFTPSIRLTKPALRRTNQEITAVTTIASITPAKAKTLS